MALFLRMESINRKTEINELRIWKVESRVETESLQTTNHKNEIETPESKCKMEFAFYRYTLVKLLMKSSNFCGETLGKKIYFNKS